MIPRSQYKHPILFNMQVIISGLAMLLWITSVWSGVRLGTTGLDLRLHRGMLYISTGYMAAFEQQFYKSWLYFGISSFEWPASLGLHWPFWKGYISDFQVGLPLFAIWAPGVILSALLHLRHLHGIAKGHCRCGYDLTGNISGQCPECGTLTNMDLSVLE